MQAAATKPSINTTIDYKNLLRTGRTSSTVVSIRVNNQLLRFAKARAAELGLSLNKLVNYLLLAFVRGEREVKIVDEILIDRINVSVSVPSKKDSVKKDIVKAKLDTACKQADKLLLAYNKMMERKPQRIESMEWWTRLSKLKNRMKMVADNLEKLIDEAIDNDLDQQTIESAKEHYIALYRAIHE